MFYHRRSFYIEFFLLVPTCTVNCIPALQSDFILNLTLEIQYRAAYIQQHQAAFTSTQQIMKPPLSSPSSEKLKPYCCGKCIELSCRRCAPKCCFPRQSNGDSAVTDTRPSWKKKVPLPSSPPRRLPLFLSAGERLKVSIGFIVSIVQTDIQRQAWQHCHGRGKEFTLNKVVERSGRRRNVKVLDVVRQ